jgi:hypothetical protein
VAIDEQVPDFTLRLWVTQAADQLPAPGAPVWRLVELGNHDRSSLPSISCPVTDMCMLAEAESDSLRSDFHAISGLTGEARDHVIGIGPASLTASAFRNNAPMFGQVKDVSCPSPTLCVAVGSLDTNDVYGQVAVSTNPFADDPAWRLFVTKPRRLTGARGPYERFVRTLSFSQIDCPSEARCVALGDRGRVGVLNNPADPRSRWRTYTVPPVSRRSLGIATGLACAPTGSCVGFLQHLHSASIRPASDILATNDPGRGRRGWKRRVFAIRGTLESFQCTSAQFCFGTEEYVSGMDGSPDSQSLVRGIFSTGPLGPWQTGTVVSAPAWGGRGWGGCWADYACVLMNTGAREVATLSAAP